MRLAASDSAIDSIVFLRRKYGCELVADARPLNGWRGLGRPDRPHRLDYLELLLIDEGCGRVALDTRDMDVAGGSLLVTAPGQVRRVDVAQPFEGRLVVCAADAVRRGLPTGRLPLTHTHAFQLRRVADAIALEIEQPHADTPAMLQALVTEVALLVKRCASDGGARPEEPAILSRLDALIDARFREDHRAAAYARELGVTLDHLSTVARRYRGVSVKTLIVGRVINEAQHLLIYGDRDVAEIAYELGFSEPAHFSRVFRQTTGLAPARFRARGSEKYQ